MIKIYLVRHGETLWNQQRRYQGQQDIALTDVGQQQASLAAKRLTTSGARFVMSSDLVRARDTAMTIAEHLGLSVAISLLWRERAYGRWEGLTREEIQKLYPDEWRKNRANPHAHAPKGSETLSELTDRAVRALESLLRDPPGQIGIVVSHGGLLRALLARITGKAGSQFTLDNGGITLIAVASLDDVSLLKLNDTAHLTDVNSRA